MNNFEEKRNENISTFLYIPFTVAGYFFSVLLLHPENTVNLLSVAGSSILYLLMYSRKKYLAAIDFLVIPRNEWLWLITCLIFFPQVILNAKLLDWHLVLGIEMLLFFWYSLMFFLTTFPRKTSN